MKPRVHFHSDNYSFAGSEHMLVVLFREALRTGEIRPSFSYRASERYEKGLRERLPAGVETEGLSLPDVGEARAGLRRLLPSRTARPLRGIVHLLATLLPIRQLFQLYDIVAIRRLLRRLRPDIVHVNNGGYPGAGSCSPAAIAAKLAGVSRIVYVVNNQAYGYDTPQRWFEYPVDRATAYCVDRFVTGSAAASKKLSEVLHLPAGRAVALPNGVAEREVDETAEETRKRLGIDPDEVLIVCIGSLEARKGHRFLVEAFGCALSQDPGLRATVVIDGEGPERSRLERRIGDLGLGNRVRIIPPERNIWNLYAASDIVVLPSVSHEDFPNVVLEAMANSKPVIASAVAGVPEQVVDGETGILVGPGEPEELASAMTRLIRSPELRQRLGAAGRRRFERNFTAERAARRYFDLYRSLLDGVPT